MRKISLATHWISRIVPVTTLPESALYYGSEKMVTKPITLRAGPLTMLFEPDTAFLRHIRLGDHEVCRAIYAAVRDEKWATILPHVRNLQSQMDKDRCQITFDVRCRREEIDYFCR